MKTVRGMDAIVLQHEAAWLYAAARGRVMMGDISGALRDQERAAVFARYARALLGMTDGGMRKATQ